MKALMHDQGQRWPVFLPVVLAKVYRAYLQPSSANETQRTVDQFELLTVTLTNYHQCLLIQCMHADQLSSSTCSAKMKPEKE